MKSNSKRMTAGTPTRAPARLLASLILGLAAACSSTHDQGDGGTADGAIMDTPMGPGRSGEITGGNANDDAGRPPIGRFDAGPLDDGTLGPTPLCTPTSCDERGATCGAISDGCGGVLTCGTCEGDAICDALTHTCVSPMEACMESGLECGAALDACGTAVPCGTCAGGEVCNAADGSCGACSPRSCEDLGACGEIPDGCGNTLICDECDGDLACDAVSKRCRPCEPTTCQAQGAQCGVISDGCGGTLDCDAILGGCDAGLACLGNRCRPPALPPECDLQMANCGAITHSCTGAGVDCGRCPEGEVCMDNRCEVCVPRTCADLEMECGTGDDGCGGTLQCGQCPSADDDGAPLTCHNNACCAPATCPAGACGTIDDGCGGSANCGACPASADGGEQVCGLVTANVCTPCTRRTCEAGECGPVSQGDGCGGELNCGSCPQDGLDPAQRNRCNRTANVCEVCTLTKTTCEPGECGRIPDGCGGRIDCGGCQDGEACGLVTANVCAPCTPTKTSCGADDCGDISDGCGGTLTCGGCDQGKQCGLVTANVCSVCTPRACPASAECGTVSDGCGGAAECGSCTGGDVCLDNACCTPKRCGDPGVGCDATDDGCGGPLDCACQGGLVCDTNGSCCQPISCLDVCGSGPYNGPDGCGNTIQCDDCRPPPG